MTRSRIRLTHPALAALAALALFPVLADAILVAPHALYLTDRQPTGEVYLVNQSDQAEDVTVEVAFGYPASDSAGDMYIHFDSAPAPGAPSAAGWLRAFPRRVRVQPGRRQAVRIQATPPAGLPDGEYWSRLIVTSQPARDAALGQGDSVVRAGITFELRTVTSVAFRKGAVATGFRLDSASATATHDSVIVWAALTREGNAAFIGSVAFDLLDAAGRTVETWGPNPIAVYYGINRRFALPVEAPRSGRHELKIRATTARTDISAGYLLPAQPLEHRIPVAFP
jgi:hypothetical protein